MVGTCFLQSVARSGPGAGSASPPHSDMEHDLHSTSEVPGGNSAADDRFPSRPDSSEGLEQLALDSPASRVSTAKSEFGDSAESPCVHDEADELPPRADSRHTSSLEADAPCNPPAEASTLAGNSQIGASTEQHAEGSFSEQQALQDLSSPDASSLQPLAQPSEASPASAESDSSFGEFGEDADLPAPAQDPAQQDAADQESVAAAAAAEPDSGEDIERSLASSQQSDSAAELATAGDNHATVGDDHTTAADDGVPAAKDAAAGSLDSDDDFGGFEDAAPSPSTAHAADVAETASAAAGEHVSSEPDNEDEDSGDGFGEFEDAPEAAPAGHSRLQQPADAAVQAPAAAAAPPPPAAAAAKPTDMLDLDSDAFLAAARALMAPFLQGCLQHRQQQQGTKDSKLPITLAALSNQLQNVMHKLGRHHSLRPAMSFRVSCLELSKHNSCLTS